MSNSTTTIQSLKSSSRKVEAICRQLVAQYGLPRHGNPQEPLFALTYLLLSKRNTTAIAEPTYKQFRLTHPRWKQLLNAKSRAIKAINKPLGLHRIRTCQIRSTLHATRAKFDVCSLDDLREMSPDEAQAFFESLPGVSTKLAKCVQMYTLNAKVLSVDVYVFRVSIKLGLIKKSRLVLSHESIERAVPPNLRYTYYVTCVALDRDICRSGPQCNRCYIRRYCQCGSRG
jgi:endonuclease-3